MKTKIILGLCLVLGMGSVPVFAFDNPAQAAARAALIQKLNQPDESQARSLPVTNTPAAALVEQPAQSTPSVMEAIVDRTMIPQTASAAATPVTAPATAAAAPATAPVVSSPVVAPAAVRPVAVAPATAAPVVSPVMLLFVLIGLLLIALVVMLVLLLKLRALKLMLLRNPAVMARAAEAARGQDSR